MSYELRWGACKAFFYLLNIVRGSIKCEILLAPGAMTVVDEIDALAIVERGCLELIVRHLFLLFSWSHFYAQRIIVLLY